MGGQHARLFSKALVAFAVTGLMLSAGPSQGGSERARMIDVSDMDVAGQWQYLMFRGFGSWQYLRAFVPMLIEADVVPMGAPSGPSFIVISGAIGQEGKTIVLSLNHGDGVPSLTVACVRNPAWLEEGLPWHDPLNETPLLLWRSDTQISKSQARVLERDALEAANEWRHLSYGGPGAVGAWHLILLTGDGMARDVVSWNWLWDEVPGLEELAFVRCLVNLAGGRIDTEERRLEFESQEP